MDLSTSYLGLKLATPLVVGASPLADDTHTARLVQDAGAGAIVMRSLFEEQIYLDELSHAPRPHVLAANGCRERAMFPEPSDYQLNPDQYLRQIENLKDALTVPVIASLNGCRPGEEVVIVGGLGVDDKGKVKVIDTSVQEADDEDQNAPPAADSKKDTKKDEAKPKAK